MSVEDAKTMYLSLMALQGGHTVVGYNTKRDVKYRAAMSLVEAGSAEVVGEYENPNTLVLKKVANEG